MWESGYHDPDIGTLKQLAEIFGTSADYIVDSKAKNVTHGKDALCIPVLGAVPAGVPLETIGDIIGRNYHRAWRQAVGSILPLRCTATVCGRIISPGMW